MEESSHRPLATAPAPRLMIPSYQCRLHLRWSASCCDLARSHQLLPSFAFVTAPDASWTLPTELAANSRAVSEPLTISPPSIELSAIWWRQPHWRRSRTSSTEPAARSRLVRLLSKTAAPLMAPMADISVYDGAVENVGACDGAVGDVLRQDGAVEDIEAADCVVEDLAVVTALLASFSVITTPLPILATRSRGRRMVGFG